MLDFTHTATNYKDNGHMRGAMPERQRGLEAGAAFIREKSTHVLMYGILMMPW